MLARNLFLVANLVLNCANIMHTAQTASMTIKNN